MATQTEIDFAYSLTDRLFRLSVGELSDFSGAKYDGDFTLPLEQAQRNKHEFVAESLKVPAGGRVADLGCGWGAMLNFLRNAASTA
jgi:cyclopropane-fatty-acyl-phospholipid synthase